MKSKQTLRKFAEQYHGGTHCVVFVDGVDTSQGAPHVRDALCSIHLVADVAQRHSLGHPLDESTVF